MASSSTSDDARLGSRVPIFCARLPGSAPLRGTFVRLERLASRHSNDLFDNMAGPLNESNWAFAHMGPFLTLPEFHQWLAETLTHEERYIWAIIDERTGRAFAMIGLFEMDVTNRTCLLGYLYTSLNLQLSRSTTEAVHLLMAHVFDELGYRRLGWDINSNNETAKRAMLRLGFVYEGTLRCREIVKGYNRNTSVYSVVEDDDWPACKWAFRRWLMPDNFDNQDRQRTTLMEFRTMYRTRTAGEQD